MCVCVLCLFPEGPSLTAPSRVVYMYMLEVTQAVSSELSWLTPVLLLLLLLPLSVTCSVYATVHAKDKQYDLCLFERANNLWRSALYHVTGHQTNAKDTI